MKQKKAPHTILLIFLSILVLLILIAAAYQSLRRTITRLSMDFYYPYLKVLKNAEIAISDEVLLMKSRQELASALQAMYRENAQLSAQNSLIESLEKENSRLRLLLDMNPPVLFHPVHAEIILRDPVSWNETFTVDRGESSGVQVGNLAVGMFPSEESGNLITAAVGRVVSVSENTATIATLLSSECILSVALPESNSHGIMQGSDTPNEETVIVKYLSAGAKYGLGEVVSTSGYSDATPAGIYVGTLAGAANGKAAQLDDSRLYAVSSVLPALDLESLRFVSILTERESLE